MEREHITPQGVSVFHDKNENIHSFCLCLYVRAGSLFETKAVSYTHLTLPTIRLV